MPATPASSTSRMREPIAALVAGAQSRAELHGDRQRRRRPRRRRAASATARSGSREQPDARAGPPDLRHGAAHVDVDDVGAGLDDSARRPRASAPGLRRTTGSRPGRRRARGGRCAASPRRCGGCDGGSRAIETISETAMPAPYRLACRRTNQLPIPASGASITRLGTASSSGVRGIAKGIVSERARLACGAIVAPLSASVAFVQQAQPRQREHVVDLARSPPCRARRAGEAARRDRRRRLRPARRRAGAGSRRSRPHSRTRPRSGSRRSCFCRSRCAAEPSSTLRQARAAIGERLERDLDAGHQRAAEVLAIAGDDVEGRRRAEVDADRAPPKRSRIATALTSRSAPISRGLS